MPPGAALRPARVAAQTIVSAVGFLAGVSLGAYFFRAPLHALAAMFVAKAGYAGMFAGTFASDFAMFPVPPQFYMLTAIAAGAPVAPSLAAICAGSVAAAILVYPFAGTLARIGFLRRQLEGATPAITPLFARWGYWAIVVGSLSPIPFSWLCWFAGTFRFPYRYYAVFVLLRMPRLFFFWALIRAGWGN